MRTRTAAFLSSNLNVGGHGAQAFPTDRAKLRGGQAAAQIFVLRRIDEIAKGLDIDGLNLRREAGAVGNLQASGERDAKNENQRQSGDDDENDS